VVSATGTWMQIVALSLLVLKLTHGSAFALGCVSLSQALAFFLFALIGGGSADRVNRRGLLLVTQATLMLLAGTLGLLTRIGAISVPLIALCAFLSGAILSFDQPARAALISTLVPEEDLLNAISLQSAVFNGAAVAGPALAGLTVARIGLSANFFLNALSFTGVLLALASLPTGPAVQSGRERLIQQIRVVLQSVRGDPVLFPLLCVYGTLLFAGPSLALLIPVLAALRLHVGPATLGFLFSAAGIGAVAGTLILGNLPTTNSSLVRAAVACWCMALALTGISSAVQLTFCSLVLLGASQSIAGAATSALLQTRVPPRQRGRVMSLNTLLLMGVRPLGDFPVGAAIAVIGAPAAAVASAAVVAVAALLLWMRTSTALKS
jgi:MFS family permease